MSFCSVFYSFVKYWGVFVFLVGSVFAEIVETDSMESILPFIEEESVLFLNVEGTLWGPTNTITDPRWQEYFSDRVQELTEGSLEGQFLIDEVKGQITDCFPKKIQEKVTAQLIHWLQHQHVIVLGVAQDQMLSYCSGNLCETLHRHLSGLNIDFEKTTDYFNPSEDEGNDDFSFARGIVFTNKKPIGMSLLNFLKKSEVNPKNVLVVDCSLQMLEDAQAVFERAGVPFIGILYRNCGCSDEFDPTLGTVEFFTLIKEEKILFDNDALKAMPSDRSLNYEALLDCYIEKTLLPESKSLED